MLGKIRNRLDKYIPFFLVLLVAAVGVRYLLLPKFVPTHDGEYHIIRFWQFDKVFRSGNIIPRWAPDLNNGRGVPLFAFFYPLPNYIAEIFVLLGFSYVKSLFLVLATGFFVSGVNFYLWMRTLFKPWPAAVGAIFYLLAPYHLVDVFVRGSVGEVWSLALIPLVLYLTTRAVLLKSVTRATELNMTFILNSVAICFLLLSHNILGPVFYLFGLGYGIILVWSKTSAKTSDVSINETSDVMASYLIGFLLSGFFWIPVLFDRQYVTGLSIVDAADHFPQLYQLLIPSWGTGFSGAGAADQMSFQIGVPHLLVVGIVSAYIVRKLKLDYLRDKMLILLQDCFAGFMLLVFSGAVVLMLSVSEPVWRIVPFMQYFQFPWRLLSLVILTGSFLAGYLASLRLKLFTPMLIGLALLFYLPYTKPVVYALRSDGFYLQNPTWTQGTATLGNSFRLKQGLKREQLDNSPARKLGDIVSLFAVSAVFVSVGFKGFTDDKI